MERLRQFISEVRRRRVIRGLVVWGVVAFAVLQVYEPLMHGLHLPEWTLSFVVIALGLGFPVAATLAWVFDLKAGGIERTPPAADGSPAAHPGRLRLALLLLLLGAFAAAPGLVYYFVWPGGAARLAGGSGAGPAVDPSIAVLPLVNLSSDREQEYFSDGLTEELLNLLAKVPGLRVAARTSSFAFKGRNEDLGTIAQKLKVAHVLEGSVRRSGDRIRITTQLISASDGYHLWSETYDRQIADVFAVQDEIATAVVAALRLKLLRAPGSSERRTTSMEAHDLYLRALYLWNLRTPDSLLRAADFFRQAVAVDPNYALAYVGLADAIEVRTGYAWVRTREVRAEAKAAALRALELDSGLGEAHASLGMMLCDELDHRGGNEHFREAIALRPDYPTAHHWYATSLAHLGQLEEAEREIQRSLQLDPTSRIVNTNAGLIALAAGDAALAERRLKAALELGPDFSTARAAIAVMYALKGRREEALAEIAKVGLEPESRGDHAVVYALTGRRAEAERLAAELEGESRDSYVPAAILAAVWTALGQNDRAFAALRRACREREGAWLDYVRVHPMYAGLRADPRFGAILDCLYGR